MDVFFRKNKNELRTISGLLVIIFLNVIQNLYIILSMSLIAFILLLLIKKEKKTSIKSLAAIMFMAVFVAVVQTVTVGSDIVYSTKLFGFNLYLYNEGLTRGIQTFLRVWGSISIILILTSTMKFNEFLMVLKHLRLPQAFIEVMSFAVKFMFIFKDEAQSIRKAQKARLGYKNLASSMQSISNIAGIVLTRAYDRSKMIEKSMKSRGYIELVIHKENIV